MLTDKGYEECTINAGGTLMFTYPICTLISRPVFMMPDHMPVDFLGHPKPDHGELLAEFAGRLCYMSQRNRAERTNKEYLANILDKRHGSVLEHANYSFLLEGVSRSFTHELVRHRAGFAYSQLSQRYVDESDTAFVIPPAIIDQGLNSLAYQKWYEHVTSAKQTYIALAEELEQQMQGLEGLDRVERRKKVREAARSVLPNSTETKIVVTANARAWRTMLELRASPGAEREIRRWGVQMIHHMRGWVCPNFFQDWEVYTAEDGFEAAKPTYSKV